MNYPNFKVCCRCFTFNQSMYITDTMYGFIMQQTSFPFVCTIVDDASTDGEQEVIRKYVDENFDFSEGSVAFNKETDYAFITFAQHKTNKNCYFAVLYLKENHYSKGMGKQKMSYLTEWRDMCEYEALCEGDDYWIDEMKLLKQVDVMDSNKECSICVGITETINREGQPSGKFMPSKSYSGLFDLEKLNNISRDVISKMTKEELLERSLNWANKFDEELKELIEKDKEYYMNIINIERCQKKPRKDY